MMHFEMSDILITNFLFIIASISLLSIFHSNISFLKLKYLTFEDASYNQTPYVIAAIARSSPIVQNILTMSLSSQPNTSKW